MLKKMGNYLKNERGEIPQWALIVIGCVAAVAVLYMLQTGLKWASGRVNDTTNSVDAKFEEWNK